jgi:ankyrin repeat protein
MREGRILSSPKILVAILVLSACSHRQNTETLNQQLLSAARNGDTGLVQHCLRSGANIEARDHGGSTPLAVAIDYGHWETVDLLLRQRASLLNAGLSGDGALIEAARSAAVNRVTFLLKRGPAQKLKEEALFAAAESAPARVAVVEYQKAAPDAGAHASTTDWSKTVSAILDNGASLEARDVEGATPLIRAAGFGNTEVVQVLLERGANVEARSNNGETALMAAACECASIDMPETLESLKLLLAKRADINAKDKQGQTALMSASSAGETENVRLLLDSGAKIDLRDSDGNTALMLAASAGPCNSVRAIETSDSVKLLVTRGANPSVRNKRGSTALELAQRAGRSDVVSILKSPTVLLR